MNILISDFLLWLIAFIISFYTWSYALWLHRQKKKRGAWGVVFLALFALLYPGFVLFFVH